MSLFLQCSTVFCILPSPLKWFCILEKHITRNIFFSSSSWTVNIWEIMYVLEEFSILDICNIYTWNIVYGKKCLNRQFPFCGRLFYPYFLPISEIWRYLKEKNIIWGKDAFFVFHSFVFILLWEFYQNDINFGRLQLTTVNR